MISLDQEKIESFCRKWKVRELALFGSALRDDFKPESDVDLLVTFEPDADWSLLDHIRMEEELSEIIGRKVDLVSRRAIERSANRIRRQSILSSARVVYAA
jgi:predicted nucleotidyltransferase